MASEGQNWFFQDSILSCALVRNWTHISWMGGENSTLNHQCSPKSCSQLHQQESQKWCCKASSKNQFIQASLFKMQNKAQKHTQNRSLYRRFRSGNTIKMWNSNQKYWTSFPHLGCILFCPPVAWCAFPNPLLTLETNTNSSLNRHSDSRDSLGGSKIWRCAWVTSEDLNDN